MKVFIWFEVNSHFICPLRTPCFIQRGPCCSLLRPKASSLGHLPPGLIEVYGPDRVRVELEHKSHIFASSYRIFSQEVWQANSAQFCSGGWTVTLNTLVSHIDHCCKHLHTCCFCSCPAHILVQVWACTR